MIADDPRMARLEILPFADEHVNAAAGLLAARHRRHRQAEPQLPARYEDPAAAREEVELLVRDGASGTVAARGGRVVGYLLGKRRSDDTWGPNMWVEASGHVVEEAEDVRDLYGAAAQPWVDEGRTRHFVLVPAHDAPLLDAWWRLSFGQQHAHGIREVEPVEAPVPEGFEIRGPREDEVEDLIDLDLALPEHQRRSPVFGALHSHSYTRDESRQEWLNTFAEGDETILIGAHEGRPVACWAFVDVSRSREHRGLTRPDRASFLGFAATLPEFRGSGIGRALTAAGFERAAEAGYPTIVTDWRVTNLLASRFWPRRGFRTSFLRLYRSIP
jgi:ribosomal protein S18 acetylase RimI-like enzyme